MVFKRSYSIRYKSLFEGLFSFNYFFIKKKKTEIASFQIINFIDSHDYLVYKIKFQIMRRLIDRFFFLNLIPILFATKQQSIQMMSKKMKKMFWKIRGIPE